MGAKAEQTRLRLLEAAEVVFARRGYTSATVDEIATEAGMSIGALYSRLGGKEDVFVAVFERYLDQRGQEIELLARSGPLDPAAMAEGWIRLVEARGSRFLLFVEFWLYAVRESAPAAARLSAALRQFDDTVEQILAAGLGAASGRTDRAVRTARSIIALYRGFALSHAVNPGPSSVEDLTESTRELLSPTDR